ncbi:MAG: transporter related protein [Frankiales bacterium]|nr:transporter related protein [Frankiales bacterium]
MTPLLSQETLQFVVIGVSTGALIALVALSIVLVQRASGVINFSAAAFGGIGACAFYSLRDGRGWPTALALIASLVLGAALGVLTHVAIRFMGRASILAKLIATLGLMSAAVGFLVVVYGEHLNAPHPILPTNRIHLTGQIQVNVQNLIIIGITFALASVLWFIYSKTLFGLATSAVSENRRVAAASGWSPTVNELVNFAAAGVLSTFAAILIAPTVTLQAQTLALLVIPALAAALLGRFTSFPLTIAGAVFIGVGQSLLALYQTDIAHGIHVDPLSLSGLPNVLPLLLIVGVLVLRGSARLRRGETQYKLQLAGDGRINRPLLALGLLVGLGLVVTVSDTWNDAVTTTMAGGILLLSIVVVTGYAGQLSLAQYSLAGFGSWAAARMVVDTHMPFVAALFLAALCTIPVGLIVAIPALRSRGVNLGIATLAMAAVIQAVVFDNSSLTGGYFGLTVSAPAFFGLSIDPIVHPNRYAMFSLGLFVLIGLMVSNVRRGRSGHRLLAVRSNERAAAALGVGVYRAKMYSFALAAGIAGVAGVLIGFHAGSNITFNNFDALSSILGVLNGVIGGIGWASGTVVGAQLQPSALGSKVWESAFPGVTELNAWLMIVSGVVVIVTLRAAPDGIAAMHSSQLHALLAKLRPPKALAVARTGDVLPRRQPATLSIEGLSVAFGGIQAVRDVSFTVSPGEIVGLMGPNGAGKTTIIDLITGFTAADSGSVTLAGEPVVRLSPEQRARRGIGRSWQTVELFDEMSLYDNLLVAEDTQSMGDYFKDLVAPGRPMISAEVAQIVADFELTEQLSLRPTSMPAGTARLAGIARAFAANPAILLLDEPAAGLDMHESEELGRTIRAFVQKHGIGVLLVEHDVEMLAKTCDRIIALDFGEVIADGPPAEVMENTKVVLSYLGSSTETVDDEAALEALAIAPTAMRVENPL